MDQRMMIGMEIKKDKHTFYFYMPTTCSFGVAYDAAFEVLKEISEASQRTMEQAKQVKEEEAPAEPTQ